MNFNDFITEDLLRRFGDDWIKTLTKHLVAHGKRASGRLIQSIDYKISKQADMIRIIIEGEDYLRFVDQGVDGKFTSYGSPYRFTTKMPPVSKIEEWCSTKGIPKSAAFPIAKNIFKFGIEPTYVIDSTLSEMRIDTDVISKNIEDWLINKFENKE
jgi:hypothetical protein